MLPTEVRSGDDLSVANHAWKTNGNALKFRKRSYQLRNTFERHCGCEGMGCVDADAISDLAAVEIDHGSLEAGSADVDRQNVKRPRVLCGRHNNAPSSGSE